MPALPGEVKIHSASMPINDSQHSGVAVIRAENDQPAHQNVKLPSVKGAVRLGNGQNGFAANDRMRRSIRPGAFHHIRAALGAVTFLIGGKVEWLNIVPDLHLHYNPGVGRAFERIPRYGVKS